MGQPLPSQEVPGVEKRLSGVVRMCGRRCQDVPGVASVWVVVSFQDDP